MKLYLATWFEDPSLNPTMTKVGARRRLLSYHFLINGSSAPRIGPKTIRHYVKTGLEDNPPKSQKETPNAQE